MSVAASALTGAFAIWPRATQAPSLPQLPAVVWLPSAKHEVWVLGPQTPVGGRRATRVDEPAAWDVREHARAPPSPSTLCALSAQAIHAAQGQLGREGRGWYPRTQLEEELDPAARTRYQ